MSKDNDGLVDELKGFGIVKDRRVEAAMRNVDRGKYSKCDPYTDSPSPIGFGQTCSAPHMHAYALEHLKSKLVPGATVLDVGSGSGYLAAAMMQMVKGSGGSVLGIDVIPELVEWSIGNVKRDDPGLFKEGLVLRVGDGWGDPALKPLTFDAIHVGASAAEVPDALVSSLKPGGLMVIPVGESWQTLKLISKAPDGRIGSRDLLDVRYVPLVRS